ncbi:DUF2970 domain-containing protein [Paraburkholderia sp. J12]|uniref:DUF2970 domain-containing protein n=1 Tax=Paraburkholderia sp. J12 TaxID=2805432 RepID=UPI002ABE5E3B|nr:DUF2970 domain-containing protein [Paraburkholderia sp. J12]
MNGAGANGEGGKKKSGVLQLFKAVAWSFFGVRKRADLEADAAQLHPVALIAAALIGAALFIGVLLLVVHLVVG